MERKKFHDPARQGQVEYTLILILVALVVVEEKREKKRD